MVHSRCCDSVVHTFYDNAIFVYTFLISPYHTKNSKWPIIIRNSSSDTCLIKEAVIVRESACPVFIITSLIQFSLTRHFSATIISYFDFEFYRELVFLLRKRQSSS